MAMLEYNEIRERKYIIMNNEPFEVLTSHVFRKQQRKPVNATKLKSLLNGRVMEYSFHVSEKVHEAEIDTKEIKYLYNNKNEWWFCESNNPGNRFKLDDAILGNAKLYLLPNALVNALLFDEKVIGIELPPKVDLKVTEAPPNVKGSTAQGGNKLVTLETGATVTVPMFINEGEVLRISTATGEYVERVQK